MEGSNICGEHGDARTTGLQEDPPLSENPVWPENAIHSRKQRNSLGSDHFDDGFSKEKQRLGGSVPRGSNFSKPQFSESTFADRFSQIARFNSPGVAFAAVYLITSAIPGPQDRRDLEQPG